MAFYIKKPGLVQAHKIPEKFEDAQGHLNWIGFHTLTELNPSATPFSFRIEAEDGISTTVNGGDWAVRDEAGGFTFYTDAQFNEIFMAAKVSNRPPIEEEEEKEEEVEETKKIEN